MSNSINIIKKFYKFFPIILLFISVLNEFDFNNLGLKYFSFNFSYILIFYYSLKKSNSLGYSYIFIAGLFNDVVVGTPIGLSSLFFLLFCVSAAYLRNITLRPSLMKDWLFFLITLLIINSLFYTVLTLFFSNEIDYINLLINSGFTFILYYFFSYLFGLFEDFFIGHNNAR
ncbi:rod shape-determining protein MreD [Candidatus Pelagibacter sp.]|nr:rod shape-determining protein MreD [Candidatus Pelagibacter sp.]